VKNVGKSDDDYEQDVEMIRLDSFFPPGTKAQNLKIDVQGNELYVLRGAERLLKENKGRLKVRFEYDEELLRASNTDPHELVDYMTSLGYKVISVLERTATRDAAYARGDAPKACHSRQPPGTTIRPPDCCSEGVVSVADVWRHQSRHLDKRTCVFGVRS